MFWCFSGCLPHPEVIVDCGTLDFEEGEQDCCEVRKLRTEMDLSLFC